VPRTMHRDGNNGFSDEYVNQAQPIQDTDVVMKTNENIPVVKNEEMTEQQIMEAIKNGVQIVSNSHHMRKVEDPVENDWGSNRQMVNGHQNGQYQGQQTTVVHHYSDTEQPY
jgi:hypothetical protein